MGGAKEVTHDSYNGVPVRLKLVDGRVTESEIAAMLKKNGYEADESFSIYR